MSGFQEYLMDNFELWISQLAKFRGPIDRIIFSVLNSNSFRIFDLTQANFEADSADFFNITQNFGIFGIFF